MWHDSYIFLIACPTGFVGPGTFHGETSCYMLVSTGARINPARTNCQRVAGADLVSVEDQAENIFVQGKTHINQH